MSSQQDTVDMLSRLENERQTGCLTIDSADGRVCRVYLLFGEKVHVEGPATEGDSALRDALSWPEVTLTFDEKTELPSKRTFSAAPSSDTVVSPQKAKGEGARAAQTLSANRSLTMAMFAYIGAGCLFALLMVLGLGIAVAEGAFHLRVESILGPGIVLLFAAGALWIFLYMRYRFMFRRDAVRVDNGLAKADIPRVIDAPGVVDGKPDLVMNLPTRYLLGRLGTCHVEFYTTGLQIWKGPDHPEPRWQFAYADLLQAESVVTEASGSRNSRDQYSLRLIAAQPRMAFLFGNAYNEQDTQQMLDELRKHGVATFNEA